MEIDYCICNLFFLQNIVSFNVNVFNPILSIHVKILSKFSDTNLQNCLKKTLDGMILLSQIKLFEKLCEDFFYLY